MASEAKEIFVTKTNTLRANIYRFQWNELLCCLEDNLEVLRQMAYNGGLKASKFRSICWSLLLRVLNENPRNWQSQREQQRNKYEKLKNEFVKNPHEIEGDLVDDDPLSQSKQSIWNQYFGDQELFAVIKQDVVRTFPGVEFFRKSSVQRAMTNILFYYAREHPYMCYRQGMHEILAPILFVMYCDHQALLEFKEISTTHEEIDNIIFDVLNPEFLEADSYALFSRLMSSIESYYRITNMVPTSTGYFPAKTQPSPPVEDGATATEVEVISQLNFIRDKILAKEDLHLHNHFLKLNIPLHIFGIRWLRLLFGREFPLEDLLTLWDAIFADSDKFELPNYILVAMLIRIRDKLLLNDYTTCLTLLMKYPNDVDIELILQHALHMQNPKKFERPNEAFVYVDVRPTDTCSSHNNKKSRSLTVKRQKSLIVSDSPLMKSHNSTLIIEKQTQRSRSSSLTGNLMFSTNEPNVDFQTTDMKIIDGYRENSTEALAAELQTAQNIMLLSRQKLRKYLFVIKQHIPNEHQSDELNQALTGIEELCSFLDVKFVETPANNFVRIDSASEAAEAGGSGQKKSQKITRSNQQQQKPGESVIATEVKQTELKTTNKEAQDISQAHKQKSGSMNFVAAKTRYEIPDNSYMRNSKRFLGTKKDFELTIFKAEHDMADRELSGVPIPDPLGIRDS